MVVWIFPLTPLRPRLQGLLQADVHAHRQGLTASRLLTVFLFPLGQPSHRPADKPCLPVQFKLPLLWEAFPLTPDLSISSPGAFTASTGTCSVPESGTCRYTDPAPPAGSEVFLLLFV